MKNDHVAEIMYESEGKNPAGEPFMRMKKSRGYFEYAERGGKDSIAFILYNNTSEKYGKGGKYIGLINESKPPLDETMNTKVMMVTAFGGSIDMEKSSQEICQIEVLEESGYEVPLDRITKVGTTLVSSMMSEMCHMYLVDVTGIEKTQLAEYETEVSEEQKAKDPTEFSGNSVVWLTPDEVWNNNDWKSIFILSKAVVEEQI